MGPIVYLFLTGRWKDSLRGAVPLCCCPHWAVGVVLPLIFGGLIGFGVSVCVPYAWWIYKAHQNRDAIIENETICEYLVNGPTSVGSGRNSGMSANVSLNVRDDTPIASDVQVVQPPGLNVFHSQDIPVATAVRVDPNSSTNIPVASTDVLHVANAAVIG